MMQIMQNQLEKDEQLNFFVQDMEENLESSEFLKNSYQDRILHFHRYVRRLHEGNYTYLEAILEFAQEHDLEYTDCVKLISPDLKSEIELECSINNQLKQNPITTLGF